MSAIAGPIDILKLALKSPVYLRLRDGEEIEGTLQAYDEHFNILLTDARLTASEADVLFIRGDQVELVSAIEETQPS
jgi:small nuclear ribonucleoprotein (snRNP)-like protein